MIYVDLLCRDNIKLEINIKLKKKNIYKKQFLNKSNVKQI